MNIIQSQIDIMTELIKTPFGIFQLVISVIIRLCVAALFLAIAHNFIEANKHTNVKKERKSIVETGTMVMFFIAFYWLLKSGIGSLQNHDITTRVIFAILGTTIIVWGTIFNILGRVALGKNWANQVKIYQDHTLVQNGVYKYVRHPLYASLIWMFFAASLVFLNYAAFLANLLIFIPFMTYRAKQEEKLLCAQFPEYQEYQSKVGIFFPMVGGKK